MYNFADDNTVSHIDEDVNQVVSKAFNENCMTKTPEIWQKIILGNADHLLKPQCEIEILCIPIDFKLNFDSHVSELCRKAARQLNAAKFIK